MIGLSMGCQLRQTQYLATSLKLNQEQRIRIQSHILQIRLSLIQALREERYEPNGECPKCGRKMTPIEIIRGFNRDPNDFTTCCSGCGYRFEARLICFGNESRIEIPFYCDAQVLARLPGKETIPPEEFARKHAGIYRSAIVHHGGIKKAFEKIGIEYLFEEISDWKSKITPFLGRLTDKNIADCVGVSTQTVSKIRQKAGIKRYSVRRAAKEIGIDMEEYEED